MGIRDLTDIVAREHLQELQDKFSVITGVATIITDTNGKALTGATGFCRLCERVRSIDEGQAGCVRSDAAMGKSGREAPNYGPCRNVGLWDAGSSIYVGERHIANWLIGQIRPADFDIGGFLRQTDRLGIERAWALEALDEVPVMEEERFRVVSELLHLFANQLSEMAYKNFQLKREVLEKNQISRQLHYMTFHDPATGLISRDLCMERIGHLIDRGRRAGGVSFSLIMLSPENLAHITEIYGTDGTGRALVYLADILKQSVRYMDTVSRYSGDEFLIVLEEDDLAVSPERVFRRICEALEEPMDLDGSLMKISIHAGLARWSRDEEAGEDDLIRRCYAALHEARKAENNTLLPYTEDMYRDVAFEFELERDLEMAIKRGEIVPYYQPIVRIEEGEPRLYGYEVLARWDHPRYGILSPSLFIPMAEKHNILSEMTRSLIVEASRFILSVNSGRETPVFLSVNVTPEEFIRENFVQAVQEGLKEQGLPGEWIKIEITENTVLKGGEDSIRKVEELNALGITLSIDDFGTGYSNLSLLCRMRLNNLKLDQSLISLAEKNENVIQAVIRMAESLDMEIIAEGVERESQIAVLERMGCVIHQGFYYARPMDGLSVRTLALA